MVVCGYYFSDGLEESMADPTENRKKMKQAVRPVFPFGREKDRRRSGKGSPRTRTVMYVTSRLLARTVRQTVADAII
jgi:hypothetical protein